ncbi:MAG: hypothetical protein OXE86_10405 [Alphaproteobacteria bacterium]|nr:hypothetical protein [Alphaproteobacteria bacterium]
MMRVAVSVGLCTMLAGCLPFLPPVMSAASLGVSGFSVLTTGKSTSDHIVSAANGKNCALHRMLFLNPICREYTEADIQIAVTYPTSFPGDHADGGPEVTAEQLVAEEKVRTLALKFGGVNGPSRIAAGTPRRLASASTIASNTVETHSLPFGSIQVAAAAPVDTDRDTAHVGAATGAGTAGDASPVVPKLVPSGLRADGRFTPAAGTTPLVLPRSSPFKHIPAAWGGDAGFADIPLPALARQQAAIMQNRESGPPSLAADRVAVPRVLSRS